MERSPSVQLRHKFKALPGDGADLGISSSYPRPQIARHCYLFWCLRFRNCLEIRADRMARKWEFFLRSAACVTSHLMQTNITFPCARAAMRRLGRIAPRRAVVDVCFLSIADLECSFSLVVTIPSNIRSEF